MTQVNRYLKDTAMDLIDHALARPVDPAAKTPRNYFMVSPRAVRAIEMAASPNWQDNGEKFGMRWFSVTPAGRAALRRHLEEIRDPHRLFVIRFDGHESSIVGTTPGNAKYRYWMQLDWDLSFADFCKRCSVRVARRATRGRVAQP